MKEFTRHKIITDLDVGEFKRTQDLRSLPLVARQLIKYRIFELRKLKWKDRQIAMALGIKIKAVVATMYKFRHFDREFEDFRANNGLVSKFGYQDLSRMMNHQELQNSSSLTLFERVHRLKEKYDISISAYTLRLLYNRAGIFY